MSDLVIECDLCGTAFPHTYQGKRCPVCAGEEERDGVGRIITVTPTKIEVVGAAGVLTPSEPAEAPGAPPAAPTKLGLLFALPLCLVLASCRSTPPREADLRDSKWAPIPPQSTQERTPAEESTRLKYDGPPISQ